MFHPECLRSSNFSAKERDDPAASQSVDVIIAVHLFCIMHENPFDGKRYNYLTV